MRPFPAKKFRLSPALIVAIDAVAVALGGVAYATIPDSGGVIRGCYDGGGNLKVIDTGKGQSCAKGFTPLNWNQQGPKGDTGAQGPAGPKGDAGATGPPSGAEGLVVTDPNVVSVQNGVGDRREHEAGRDRRQSRVPLLARSRGSEPPRRYYWDLFLPLALGRPVWVDDPYFNLGYHLRRTALPEPGGDEQLRLLIGRVMSQQLDRHQPLWEMWMIESLSERRWALVTKLHHSMVDGVSGAELLSAILDEQREPELAASAGWFPERQPSGAELAVRALAHRALSPFEGLRSTLDSPRAAAERAVGTVEGLLALSGVLRPPRASSLNGLIGPHRHWDWARSRLSEVKLIRAALGGTVNDVVLTAIAGGFRELLASRGERTDRVVRSLVPVSVRAGDERGEYNNRVSAIFADLPVGIEDPV